MSIPNNMAHGIVNTTPYQRNRDLPDQKACGNTASS
jgi:hypothetical protein